MTSDQQRTQERIANALEALNDRLSSIAGWLAIGVVIVAFAAWDAHRDDPAPKAEEVEGDTKRDSAR